MLLDNVKTHNQLFYLLY